MTLTETPEKKILIMVEDVEGKSLNPGRMAKRLVMQEIFEDYSTGRIKNMQFNKFTGFKDKHPQEIFRFLGNNNIIVFSSIHIREISLHLKKAGLKSFYFPSKQVFFVQQGMQKKYFGLKKESSLENLARLSSHWSGHEGPFVDIEPIKILAYLYRHLTEDCVLEPVKS